MSDPYENRDLLADFGAQPDDKPTTWDEAPITKRFVGCANEIGWWGVRCTRDGEWAVFPQEAWRGEAGKIAARLAAADEEEWDS